MSIADDQGDDSSDELDIVDDMDSIDPSDPRQIIGVVVQAIESRTQAFSYSGPLPPASEFAKYENTLPGAADRILKLAETGSAHGIAMDTRNQDRMDRVLEKSHEANMSRIGGATKSVARGHNNSIVVSLATLATACVFALVGIEWPASLVGVGPVAALVGAFFWYRRMQVDITAQESLPTPPDALAPKT